MIDVSSLVGDVDVVSSALTLRTYGASAPDAFGVATETATDVALVAVVHTVAGQAVQRLGLDLRRETISVYAETLIGARGRRPPAIQYQGLWYEVMAVEDYIELGGICIAHAQLLDQGAVL